MTGVAEANNLACPIDTSPMQVAGDRALRCERGHCFDRSREGYYNLLAVQHKASRDPGDSAAMVAARRRFLDTGHYAVIAAHVSGYVASLAEETGAESQFRLLDAGCGEGYYLERIAQANLFGRLQLAGIDISKWAIKAAAKRNIDCVWAVASNRRLPFAAGSIDLILSMFGFPQWDRFALAQPFGGTVLLVDPGPDHLVEMRAVIYPQVRATAPAALETAMRAGYWLADEQRLRFSAMLNGPEQIADLLNMTPHAHRVTEAGRAALAQLGELAVTGDIVFRLLKRGAVPPTGAMS